MEFGHIVNEWGGEKGPQLRHLVLVPLRLRGRLWGIPHNVQERKEQRRVGWHGERTCRCTAEGACEEEDIFPGLPVGGIGPRLVEVRVARCGLLEDPLPLLRCHLRVLPLAIRPHSVALRGRQRRHNQHGGYDRDEKKEPHPFIDDFCHCDAPLC